MSDEAPEKAEANMTRRRWLAGIVTLLGLSLVPLRWATTAASAAMRERLVAALRRLHTPPAPFNYVILEVPRPFAYVQFAGSHESAVIKGEAVADQYLATPLTPAQRVALRRLGWRDPVEGTSPNHWQRWTVRSDAERRVIAKVAAATLTSIYGWTSGSPLHVTMSDGLMAAPEVES